MPQDPEPPAHEGTSPPPPEGVAAANVENFFSSFTDLQWGHFVPLHSLERTNTSLSLSQALQ